MCNLSPSLVKFYHKDMDVIFFFYIYFLFSPLYSILPRFCNFFPGKLQCPVLISEPPVLFLLHPPFLQYYLLDELSKVCIRPFLGAQQP